jgi:hypothetical protein
LAQEQACAVVRAEDPLLEQLLEVRIITTHRPAEASPLSNHVSLRIAKEYGTMVYHERAGRSPAEAVMFCFMASDQLEPIIVAVVVHPELGRLQYITDTQLQQLEVAIGQFKGHFKLDGETYAYTGAKELLAGSWYSRHFHLKICIPTEMYLQIFPAMQVLARKRHVVFVQMSFDGHVHKEASDQLQKKLQEEAMADDADKLAAGMAGMDVKDDDKMSIGSSNAAETQLAMLQAQIRHLQRPEQCHGDDDYYFDGAVGADDSCCVS